MGHGLLYFILFMDFYVQVTHDKHPTYNQSVMDAIGNFQYVLTSQVEKVFFLS